MNIEEDQEDSLFSQMLAIIVLLPFILILYLIGIFVQRRKDD